MRSGPAYLDVGCSTGFVVEAAREAGWDAIGIDLNPSAVEFGRARGLDLRTVALEDAGFARGQLRRGVAVRRARAPARSGGTLRSCVRLLRPGGIVFLYVPNYDSASRLLMGSRRALHLADPPPELLHAGHDARLSARARA